MKIVSKLFVYFQKKVGNKSQNLTWFLFACLHIFFSIQALVKTMPRRFQGFGAKGFVSSEKDHWFFKNPTWQLKQVCEYRRGKFVFYFLNKAARTCSSWLNIWKNFHLLNTLQIYCLSAFNQYRNTTKIHNTLKKELNQLKALNKSVPCCVMCADTTIEDAEWILRNVNSGPSHWSNRHALFLQDS